MSDVDQITKPVVDFDPDALREKYGQERGKRLRADAENQYVQMLNAFNELLAEWRAKGDLPCLIVHRDMHCADPFALSSQDRRVG